jgi:hypothetical protein
MADKIDEKAAVDAKAKADADALAAAEAEKAKAQDTGKKDESTLEGFLEGGKAPADINKALEEEKAKANKEAAKEVEALEKTGKLPAKEPSKKEEAAKPAAAKSKEKPVKESEELIPEEMRKKYNIPETIKTYKAWADWGPNAEANMKKALAEKDRLLHSSTETEKRLAQMETALREMSKGMEEKVVEGSMSEEEKLIKEEQMRYLMENKPLEFFQRIKEEIQKEAKVEEQKRLQSEAQAANETSIKAIKERQQKEFDVLKEKYGEKFDTEVLPAIKLIIKDDEAMSSFYTAEKIYLYNLKIAQEKTKAEDDAKLKEKEGLSSETSHRSAEIGSDGSDKALEAINAVPDNATLGELEVAAKKAKLKK